MIIPLLTLLVLGVGGGHNESCDANISEKCLCSHHDNTAALIKHIPVRYCHSKEKLPKFQFERKKYLNQRQINDVLRIIDEKLWVLKTFEMQTN